MNKLKITILTFFVFVFSSTALAQIESGSVWKVKCVSERINKSTLKMNGLCLFRQIDSATIQLQHVELRFGDENVVIIVDDELDEVKYSFDPENGKLAFTFRKKDYEFNTLEISGDEDLILKDSDSKDGTMVVLDRTEN